MKRDDNGAVVNTGMLCVRYVPDDIMRGIDAYVRKHRPMQPNSRQTSRSAAVVALLREALRLPEA